MFILNHQDSKHNVSWSFGCQIPSSKCKWMFSYQNSCVDLCDWRRHSGLRGRVSLKPLVCRDPLYPRTMKTQSQRNSPALGGARRTHYAFNYPDQINDALRRLPVKHHYLSVFVWARNLWTSDRHSERSLLRWRWEKPSPLKRQTWSGLSVNWIRMRIMREVVSLSAVWCSQSKTRIYTTPRVYSPEVLPFLVAKTLIFNYSLSKKFNIFDSFQKEIVLYIYPLQILGNI